MSPGEVRSLNISPEKERSVGCYLHWPDIEPVEQREEREASEDNGIISAGSHPVIIRITLNITRGIIIRITLNITWGIY